EEDLLPRWATAQLRGDTRVADEALAVLGAAALQVAAVGKDRLLLESVDAIRTAGESERAALALGHSQFAEAKHLQDRLDVTRARVGFEGAEAALVRGRSAYALWAGFYRALRGYYEDDGGSLLRDLDSLAGRVDPDRYPILSGRIDWMRGLDATSRMQH